MLHWGKDIFHSVPKARIKYGHFLDRFSRRPEHDLATWEHFWLVKENGYQVAKVTDMMRSNASQLDRQVDPFSADVFRDCYQPICRAILKWEKDNFIRGGQLELQNTLAFKPRQYPGARDIFLGHYVARGELGTPAPRF